MNPPLMSVITRTFDRAHILGRAVRSVLAQTFQDFELIIVDDASMDETPAAIERLRAEDSRIRSIRRPINSRAFEPWEEPMNDGLGLARGHLLAYLDDDNQWREGFLATMVPTFDDASVVLAYCDICDHACAEQIARERRSDPRSMTFPVPGTFIAPHLGHFERIELGPNGFYADYIDTNEMMHTREALDRIGGTWSRHPLTPEINAAQGPGSEHRTHPDLQLVERVVATFGPDRLRYVPDVLVDYVHASSPHYHDPEAEFRALAEAPATPA